MGLTLSADHLFAELVKCWSIEDSLQLRVRVLKGIKATWAAEWKQDIENDSDLWPQVFKVRSED